MMWVLIVAYFLIGISLTLLCDQRGAFDFEWDEYAGMKVLAVLVCWPLFIISWLFVVILIMLSAFVKWTRRFYK